MLLRVAFSRATPALRGGEGVRVGIPGSRGQARRGTLHPLRGLVHGGGVRVRRQDRPQQPAAPVETDAPQAEGSHRRDRRRGLRGRHHDPPQGLARSRLVRLRLPQGGPLPGRVLRGQHLRGTRRLRDQPLDLLRHPLLRALDTGQKTAFGVDGEAADLLGAARPFEQARAGGGQRQPAHHQGAFRGRPRPQLQAHLGERAQGSEGAHGDPPQVVSGHVLHDPSTRPEPPAAAVHELDAEDEVARRAGLEPPRTRPAAAQGPAESSRLAPVRRLEGELLAAVGQHRLHLAQPGPRPGHQDQLLGLVGDHAGQPRQVHPRGLGRAPSEAGLRAPAHSSRRRREPAASRTSSSTSEASDGRRTCWGDGAEAATGGRNRRDPAPQKRSSSGKGRRPRCTCMRPSAQVRNLG